MEITALYLIGVNAILIWIWLNVLASIAVRHDSTLDRFQVVSQTILIWLAPYFGAAFVLHLVWQHYPNAIPKSWVPWPFKKMIFGKEPPRHKNRNDDESTAINGSLSRHNHGASTFGGDGGSSD